MNFAASLRKELLEQWRTYRLLVTAVVLVAFGMLSPLLAKFMPEFIKLIPGAEQFAPLIPAPTLADAIIQYVKNISQFSLLLALFLTMGAIALEKDKGTAVLILVKPLPRAVFLLSKFIALGVTFLIGLALAGLAGYYYTLLLFRAPDLSAWLWLNGLIWVYTMVYVALTLLASTIFRSQAAVVASAFGALLVISGLGAIPNLGRYLPGQLISWGTQLFNNPSARFWPAAWISLSLILISLLSAWLIFRKQEL